MVPRSKGVLKWTGVRARAGKIRNRTRTRPEGVLLDPCVSHASVHVTRHTVSVEQDFADRQSFFLGLRLQVRFSGMIVSAETGNFHTVAQKLGRLLRHMFCCALAGGVSLIHKY